MVFFSSFIWDQPAKIRQHSSKERLKITLSLTVICWKLLKLRYNSTKSSNFTDFCMVGGGEQLRAPYYTNVCIILRLCGAISSFSLDVSPLNLVSYLIFKALLQPCRWIFAYWSLSKLVRIYDAASGNEKNDRITCSLRETHDWRVIYSQNIQEMFEEGIDIVTKDLLRLKQKKSRPTSE